MTASVCELNGFDISYKTFAFPFLILAPSIVATLLPYILRSTPSFTNAQSTSNSTAILFVTKFQRHLTTAHVSSFDQLVDFLTKPMHALTLARLLSKMESRSIKYILSILRGAIKVRRCSYTYNALSFTWWWPVETQSSCSWIHSLFDMSCQLFFYSILLLQLVYIDRDIDCNWSENIWLHFSFSCHLQPSLSVPPRTFTKLT